MADGAATQPGGLRSKDEALHHQRGIHGGVEEGVQGVIGMGQALLSTDASAPPHISQKQQENRCRCDPGHAGQKCGDAGADLG